MYDWSIKKNQYWVSAAQERDCSLPDSNQDSQKKKKKKNHRWEGGRGTQLGKGKHVLFILYFYIIYILHLHTLTLIPKGFLFKTVLLATFNSV